jgi:hypothetical protein
MGEWLLSRRDRVIVARHEYVFSGPIVLVLVLVRGWGIEAGCQDGRGRNGESKRRKVRSGHPKKRTRTKDENEHEHYWEMALNTYLCEA